MCIPLSTRSHPNLYPSGPSRDLNPRPYARLPSHGPETDKRSPESNVGGETHDRDLLPGTVVGWDRLRPPRPGTHPGTRTSPASVGLGVGRRTSLCTTPTRYASSSSRTAHCSCSRSTSTRTLDVTRSDGGAGGRGYERPSTSSLFGTKTVGPESEPTVGREKGW